MISIAYQAAQGRHAMFMMDEQDVSAGIVCRQGSGKEVVPTVLNFGREHHRVYRIGGWVVEQYIATLALYKIPGREHLNTAIAISFDHPVGMDLILCDGEEDVLRQEEGLSVTGIDLDDGITVRIAREETGAAAEEAWMPSGSGGDEASGQLRMQCRALEEELSRLQEENTGLKAENAGLRDEGLDRQIQELLRRRDDLAQETAEKQSRLEMLEAERETMQAQKERLEWQIQSAQAESGKLRLSLEDLRRHMEAYEQHRLEVLSRNQLVEIDVEATMQALGGSFEELLHTQDAVALLEQADVAESLMKAREILEDAQKTLTQLIRVREELDRKIHQSLRRASPKGEM